MIIMHGTDPTTTFPQRIYLEYIDRNKDDNDRLEELLKSPLGENVRAFAHEDHEGTRIELWSLDSKLRVEFTEKLRTILN